MIQSVEKAMKILSQVADGYPDPVTLQTISEKTNIHKSTCVHILETLCEEGYVRRISHSLGYALGAQTFCLTRYGKFEEDLISICHPLLRWLSRKTGKTALLAVVENRQKYIIDYVDGGRNLFSRAASIREDDVYRTATGRVILSRMSEEELREHWRICGAPRPGEWPEVDSFEALCRELKTVKRQKVVKTATLMGGMWHLGYAAEIHDARKTCGAIGVGFHIPPEEFPFPEQTENEICRNLTRCAEEACRRLSYH